MNRKLHLERWKNENGTYQPVTPLIITDINSLLNTYKSKNKLKILDFCGGDPTGQHPVNPRGGVSTTSSYLISQILENLNINYQYTIIDIKGNQPINPRITFVQSDAQNIKNHINKEFDLIFGINCYQEPSIDEEVIGDLYDLTKPDGKHLGLVPGTIEGGTDLVLGIESIMKGYSPRRYTPKGLKTLFEKFKWRVKEIKTINADVSFPKQVIFNFLKGKEKKAINYINENLNSATGSSYTFGKDLLELFEGKIDSLTLPAVFYKIVTIKE